MTTLNRKSRVPPRARPLLRECKRLIQGLLPDAAVILYGSQARGTATPESDYDLLVLTNAPLTADEEDRVRDAVYDVELDRGAIISLMFFDRGQWDTRLHQAMPLRKEIEQEGVLL